MKIDLRPNINEIKLGKANYILNRYDGRKKYLYININNEEIINQDITIDIKVEGLDVYRNYDISINSYFSYEKNFDDNNVFISKGYYDNITNIGIIKFLSKEMKKYYKSGKTNILIISISFNSLKNKSLDIMIKATPIFSFLLPLKYEKLETPIPQFEHFFSYIDFKINDYLIFHLSIINENHHYISIELHFLNDKNIEFSLHSDKSILIENNKDYLYKNETNKDLFDIVDERNQNGKRSIILNLKNKIRDIFLIIFSKHKNRNLEKEFFSVKYYGLTNDDYKNGKYLYKNRFVITDSKLKINKEHSIIIWEKIQLTNLKENKGEIKIDYYVKFIKNFPKNENNNRNIGLFNNYIYPDKTFGIHLINKNDYKLIDSINFNENMVIYLIAKFNELNGMENFLIYEPLLLTKESRNDKNREENKINSNENNKIDEKDNKKVINIIFKIFIFVLILIIISLIILNVFKCIRKIQIKNACDKYIKGNNDANKKKALFSEDKLLPFESKISFLIEN